MTEQTMTLAGSATELTQQLSTWRLWPRGLLCTLVIHRDNAGVVNLINNICVNSKALLSLTHSQLPARPRGGQVIENQSRCQRRMTADGSQGNHLTPPSTGARQKSILGSHPDRHSG
jgi:hypothetical protein